MIGLLRFLGLMNAAVWFGAAVFYLLGAGPLATSSGMETLLGQKHSGFYTVAIAQLIAARYFHWHLACSLIALAHLAGEWLYLGKYPRRPWLGLVAGLLLVGFVQGNWLQPRLAGLHEAQFTSPQLRETARQSYRLWHGVSLTLDWLVLAGLGIYLWRVAHPADPARFVSATKFRS